MNYLISFKQFASISNATNMIHIAYIVNINVFLFGSCVETNLVYCSCR